jgi:hypothetical protein
MATGVASPNADCGTRYECTFEYPDVPTETELVIKTSGAKWAPTYEYGVVLRSTEVAGGVVARDVVAIEAADYQVAVQIALGGGMQAGNGIVLGEVHDCGDVRVSNAVVNVAPSGKGPFYFTSNEAAPLPDASAKSTGVLGLFATFDVPPGPAVVAASGLSQGTSTALGFARVRVFPDSVAMIRLKGPLPAGP